MQDETVLHLEGRNRVEDQSGKIQRERLYDTALCVRRGRRG